MSNFTHGRHAEAVAAAFLVARGCRVLAQNWRTRWCEIDVVAERAGTVFFVEVKYRQNRRQGRGLEYITPAKLRRMAFAAEVWVQRQAWAGDYQLCAIEVSGADYQVTAALKL